MTIIGVDEAGRGALAGPVVAAAVILDPDLDPTQFTDSKQLTPAKRDHLYQVLTESKSKITISKKSPERIDHINILNATLEAMAESITTISPPGKLPVQIDGNKSPKLKGYEITTHVKGDATIPEISAASIIAKVTRDQLMDTLHHDYPEYEWNQNKGYGTKDHYKAIMTKGYCIHHRKSFNLTQQDSLF